MIPQLRFLSLSGRSTVMAAASPESATSSPLPSPPPSSELDFPLDDDSLALIFSLLPSTSDRAAISLVSHRWLRVVSSLRESLVARGSLSLVPDRFPHLRALDLSLYPPPTLSTPPPMPPPIGAPAYSPPKNWSRKHSSWCGKTHLTPFESVNSFAALGELPDDSASTSSPTTLTTPCPLGFGGNAKGGGRVIAREKMPVHVDEPDDRGMENAGEDKGARALLHSGEGQLDEEICQVAASCRSLQILRLPRWHAALSDTSAVEIGLLLRQLEEVSLEGCRLVTGVGISSILVGCSRLRSLNVAGCSEVGDDGFAALSWARCARSLVQLTLDGCTYATDATLEAVGRHCPALRHLSADACGANGSGFSAIAQNCRELEVVRFGLGRSARGFCREGLLAVANACVSLRGVALLLKHVDHVTTSQGMWDEVIAAFASGCPLLEDLTVTHRMSDVSLFQLGAACKNLTRLDVSHSSRISDAGLVAVSRGCRLQEIVCASCPRISDMGVVVTVLHRRDIRALDVSDIPAISDLALVAMGLLNHDMRALALRHTGVTDQGVRMLALGCTQLESLDVSRCQVSDDGMCPLFESCHRLKIVTLDRVDVSNAAMFHLSLYCQELSILTIGSPRITPLGLKAVARSCPKLRNLDITGCSITKEAAMLPDLAKCVVTVGDCLDQITHGLDIIWGDN